MILKKSLFAGAAVMALMTAAASVHAADLDPLVSEPAAKDPLAFYVSIFGGVSFRPDEDLTVTYSGALTFATAGTASFNTGFIAGIAAGAEVYDNLRAELEFAYQRNALDDGGLGTAADVNASAYAILANLWYDIDAFGGAFKPYVGGGIGVGVERVNLNVPGTDTLSDLGFAFQAGVGVNYAVTSSVDIGLGYRFRGTVGASPDLSIGGLTLKLDDYTPFSHNIIGSLTYRF